MAGQVQNLLSSLYWSPLASTKVTDLSLQIAPYKEDGKKVNGFQPCFMFHDTIKGKNNWFVSTLHS